MFVFTCADVGPQPVWRRPLGNGKFTLVTSSARATVIPKKGPEYYDAEKEVHKDFVSGDDLITIRSVLDAV